MSQHINKIKRGPRTSQKQYDIYVYFLENNNDFVRGKNDPTVDPQYLENKWIELTYLLNAGGVGPQKSLREWKKTFKGWKNQTRTKARKINQHMMGAERGTPLNIRLTATEERLLDVIGGVTVEDNTNTEQLEVELPVDITDDEIESIINNNAEEIIIKEERETEVPAAPGPSRIRRTRLRKCRETPLSTITAVVAESATKNTAAMLEIAKSLSRMADSIAALAASKSHKCQCSGN